MDTDSLFSLHFLNSGKVMQMLFVRKSVALGVLGGGTHRVAFDYFHNTFIAWKSPGRQITSTALCFAM